MESVFTMPRNTQVRGQWPGSARAAVPEDGGTPYEPGREEQQQVRELPRQARASSTQQLGRREAEIESLPVYPASVRAVSLAPDSPPARPDQLNYVNNLTAFQPPNYHA